MAFAASGSVIVCASSDSTTPGEIVVTRIEGLGGLGMLYVVYLLWEHKDTAAGTASGTLLFKLTPWIVVSVFVLGAALATYFKLRDPRRYGLIGRIVYDEAVERD